MPDRRADDSPLAPRRSLAGRGDEGFQRPSDGPVAEPARAPMSAPTGVSGNGDGWSRSDTAGREAPARTATGSSQRPTAARPTATRRPRTRKARLRLTHLDPWSVMKTSFLLSVALGIVTVIAVAVVWTVLSAAGVWDSINQTVQEVIGGENGSTFDIENYVGTSRVLGFTMVVAVVDVILVTAIATLGAFLYNLSATLLGGLEVTLVEDEH